MVTYTCNHNTQDADAGGLCVPRLPGLQNVILLAKLGELPEHRIAKVSLDNTVRSHLKKIKVKYTYLCF